MKTLPHTDTVISKYIIKTVDYRTFKAGQLPDKLGLLTARYYWFEIQYQRGRVSGPVIGTSACVIKRLAEIRRQIDNSIQTATAGRSLCPN